MLFYLCMQIKDCGFLLDSSYPQLWSSTILWDKKHFRVQQITNPGSSEDSYLSFENEETDLDQDINFQSDLLSSSGSSSSESSNNNE